MAASVKKMVGVSDDSSSSSSDDEALKRCQEAVWEARADRREAGTDGDSHVKQSKRVVVADHEHDGNELQVSQGFRTHVAKKLGHILDSCITETQTKTSSCMESERCDDDDDDEGFRLFSTSVPGQTAEEPPAPVRRRPPPSSSDSDNEMETRLREAAVAVKDLLPPSTQPSTQPSPQSAPATEPPCPGKKKKKKKKKEQEGEENHIVKKKKKRKQNQEEHMDCESSPPDAQSNGEHRSSEQENMQVKVKDRKKKKREGNKMEA